jgi:hypothetical protein
MKRRGAIVGILGAAAVALVWFAISDPSVSVRDVRQPETLVLGVETGHPAYSISIHGSGRIDGEATITLLLGGQPYRVEKLSGRVDFRWGGDWYSETAEVRYEPADVRSGKVVLHCSISKF